MNKERKRNIKTSKAFNIEDSLVYPLAIEKIRKPLCNSPPLHQLVSAKCCNFSTLVPDSPLHSMR